MWIQLQARRVQIALAYLFILYSCNEGPTGLVSRDIRPPELLAQESFEKRFTFEFDEALVKAELLDLRPAIPVQHVEFADSKLNVVLQKNTVPGSSYLLRARVYDANDNMLNFLARVYGNNSNPAKLLINELNPEGSKNSNSPEVVEFYAVKGGNIGGLTFAVGTLEENRGTFVFPPLDVATGDFILLHTRWDPSHKYDIKRGNESEANSKSEAQARLSSDEAWDFWSDEISGLSDTNNALALYDSPQDNAKIMDAILYSTSFTVPKYRGWRTSFLLRQVDRLEKLGAWKGVNLVPEDAIRSKDSTGTRSLSRRYNASGPIDTDSAADWIIVPTKQYSFGTANAQTEYAPKAK